MTSRSFSFLEQFIGECSLTESALEESTDSSSSNSLPSIVRLDLPTEQSHTESNSSSTRLLNGSHRQYSAIGVPVPANGQTIGIEESEEQVADESCTNACCTFLERYKNLVIDFRNSCYIHIMHLIFSYIAFASIIVGSVYLHECPLASFLPIFAIVVGVVGLVFIAFGSAVNCREHFGNPCSRFPKLALGMLFALFSVLVISEMYLVRHFSPSFDPSAEDYCNETFYYYVIGKEIMTAIAIIISVLIYFPGSSLQTCCQNFPVPSPASAFFSSL